MSLCFCAKECRAPRFSSLAADDASTNPQGCDTTRSKAARDASARAIVEDWSTEGSFDVRRLNYNSASASAVRALVPVLTKEEWDAMRKSHGARLERRERET